MTSVRGARSPRRAESILAAALAWCFCGVVPAEADTLQDFDTAGTAYNVIQHATAPAGVVLGGGPTGSFLRLVSGASVNSLNTAAFDRSDTGAFCQFEIEFDFRITPGTGSADGFGVAMLNTARHGEDGNVAMSEEPNLDGSLGVGFDIHPNGTELNGNHVSVHYDGALVAEIDATPVMDLDATAGAFAHAEIHISSADSAGDVTVILTPPGGGPVTLVDQLSISALRPYEGRLQLGARTGGQSADHDFDNLEVRHVGCPAVLGEWGDVLAWPFIAIHADLLPDGNVLFWDRDDQLPGPPQLFDPLTETVTPASDPGFNLFCSGHSFLADGRLFVAGGHDMGDGFGLPFGHVYDWRTDSWTQVAATMNAGRWYPTNTTLGDGRVVVVSGSITPGVNNPLPQVFDPASESWLDLTGASFSMPLYPLMHLAPDGRLFNPGPDPNTRFLDVAANGGTGAWTSGPGTGGMFRSTGSSVAYEPGKVLLMGGGNPPTASSQAIDLEAPVPAWRQVDPMHYVRRQLNATLMADGNVLVTGGTSEVGFNSSIGTVFAGEMWDPTTERWKVLAGAQTPRIYHSFAMLLPDARILVGGGGHPPGALGGSDHFNGEIYSPPYLFQGPRPVMTSSHAAVSYGRGFVILTPDETSIEAVHLIRLSSVTHSFNQNQRIVRLPFRTVAGAVLPTVPSDHDVAPPGHYMLFLIDDQGVPSLGQIVKLGNPPPVRCGLGAELAFALPLLMALRGQRGRRRGA